MKCPGQDTQYWDSDAIFETKCPECGQPMEFFKDDTTRRCSGCGKKQVNPKMDFGCASYCQFAEQCLGTLPKGFTKGQEDLLKDKVAVEMKRYFGKDFKRIGHAAKVARYAEALLKEEKADPAVVMCAAFLHDIGIKNSEKKFNSSAARYQEQEGPPVAREILEKLKAAPELIDEVCDIIAHHHSPRSEETINFKILYDADMITNIKEAGENKTPDPTKLAKKIDRLFLTESGRRLAKNELMEGYPHESHS